MTRGELSLSHLQTLPKDSVILSFYSNVSFNFSPIILCLTLYLELLGIPLLLWRSLQRTETHSMLQSTLSYNKVSIIDNVSVLLIKFWDFLDKIKYTLIWNPRECCKDTYDHFIFCFLSIFVFCFLWYGINTGYKSSLNIFLIIANVYSSSMYYYEGKNLLFLILNFLSTALPAGYQNRFQVTTQSVTGSANQYRAVVTQVSAVDRSLVPELELFIEVCYVTWCQNSN